MKRITALILAALMLLTAALSFTSCQSDMTDSEKVKAAGKLVVGVTVFEPMDYKDADGNWVGFDAELAAMFAKEVLGVEVEFVIIDWDNKVFELNAGTIDCVWNGMTLGDEVKAAMSCSNAYCNNAQVVVVNKSVADQYTTAEACKTLNFAVEKGSGGKEQAELNGFKFTEVKDMAAALMEVSAGTSDAAVIDSLMAAATIGEGTSYEQLTYTVKLNSELYGVGFRQNSDLTDMLNAFFKTAYASGKLTALAEKYGVQEALIEQK